MSSSTPPKGIDSNPEIWDFFECIVIRKSPELHRIVYMEEPRRKQILLQNVQRYHHVGFEIHITYNGRFVYQDLSWQDRLWDWMAGHWNAFRNWKFGDSIQDHSIESYVQHLQQEERRHPEFENKSNDSSLGLIWVNN